MLDSWSSKLSVEFDWGSEGPGWDPWPIRTTTSSTPAALEARQITSADPKSHMETNLRCCIWLCFAVRIVNLWSQVAKAKTRWCDRLPFLCWCFFRLIRDHALLHWEERWDFVASPKHFTQKRAERSIYTVNAARYLCSLLGVIRSDNWGGNKKDEGKSHVLQSMIALQSSLIITSNCLFYVPTNMSLLWCIRVCVCVCRGCRVWGGMFVRMTADTGHTHKLFRNLGTFLLNFFSQPGTQ